MKTVFDDSWKLLSDLWLRRDAEVCGFPPKTMADLAVSSVVPCRFMSPISSYL